MNYSRKAPKPLNEASVVSIPNPSAWLYRIEKQTSYLSDITPLCSDLENEQTGGFGFDATANFKITDRTSIYAFYRYWDIDDSNPNTFACGGFVGIGLEPKNVTNEAGIGVAFKF